MLPILLSLLAFVASGIGLTYWLRQSKSHTIARQAAQSNVLASLHWRDFMRLVLQAMKGRGYTPIVDEHTPADGIPSDGSDIVLAGHHDERVLLSCKYGTASVVSAHPLMGLAKAATLHGAEKAIVVTPGKFDDEALRIGGQQNIELIDGEQLWVEIRPYISTQDAGEPTTQPKATTLHAYLLSWGAALIIAGLVWLLTQGLSPEADTTAQPLASASTADTAQTEQHAQPTASESAASATPDNKKHAETSVPALSVIPTDPAALEARRREAANAVSTLFGVDRALWSTQSTLMVYLTAAESDPMNQLCPLLERYPELAASRIQLQPPADSNKPVRFRQCRAY
jgi:restriction system protein